MKVTRAALFGVIPRTSCVAAFHQSSCARNACSKSTNGNVFHAVSAKRLSEGVGSNGLSAASLTKLCAAKYAKLADEANALSVSSICRPGAREMRRPIQQSRHLRMRRHALSHAGRCVALATRSSVSNE